MPSYREAGENRTHGKDERIGVKDLYAGREFLYRLVRELGATRGGCEMRTPRRSLIASVLVLTLGVLLAASSGAPAFQLFRTEEASIADIHAALKARTLTCRALVQMYLDRIEAYDKKGPALNDRQAEPPLAENQRCQRAVENGARLRDALQKAMDDANLDALVYPTWAFPPRMIGDLNTPHGNNSPRLSPPTGFPAITVPMGFVRDTLPVGLQVLGRAWSEPTLIKIVYAYEQATRHRRPPASTPPLPARP